MEWKLVDTVKYLVKSEMSILRDLDNCDFGYAFDGSNITARLFVLTNVVPFVLFWGGALLPVFTENRIAFVLALVPFLVWTSILRMMGGNYSVDFRLLRLFYVPFHYGFVHCGSNYNGKCRYFWTVFRHTCNDDD